MDEEGAMGWIRNISAYITHRQLRERIRDFSQPE